jgi:hypothetical protein
MQITASVSINDDGRGLHADCERRPVGLASEVHVDYTGEQCILCHKGAEQTPR